MSLTLLVAIQILYRLYSISFLFFTLILCVFLLKNKQLHIYRGKHLNSAMILWNITFPRNYCWYRAVLVVILKIFVFLTSTFLIVHYFLRCFLKCKSIAFEINRSKKFQVFLMIIFNDHQFSFPHSILYILRKEISSFMCNKSEKSS